MKLEGSVAVITGGASGIGAAVAKGLAKSGVKIVIGDLNQEHIDAVVADIISESGEAVGALCDVTKDKDTANLMDLAIETFGEINIVVPSAGIIKDALMIGTDRATKKVKRTMTTDQFRAVVEVNLVGSFITLREASARMIDNGWAGVLFTISSVNKVGQIGQLNYASTKASVALWPKILVGEFQSRGIKNIRVVGIAPGYVGTPMVKGMNQKALENILSGVHIGRLIEPEEIASLIKSVVENGAINATTIEITGGLISNGLAK